MPTRVNRIYFRTAWPLRRCGDLHPTAPFKDTDETIEEAICNKGLRGLNAIDRATLRRNPDWKPKLADVTATYVELFQEEEHAEDVAELIVGRKEGRFCVDGYEPTSVIYVGIGRALEAIAEQQEARRRRPQREAVVCAGGKLAEAVYKGCRALGIRDGHYLSGSPNMTELDMGRNGDPRGETAYLPDFGGNRGNNRSDVTGRTPPGHGGRAALAASRTTQRDRTENVITPKSHLIRMLTNIDEEGPVNANFARTVASRIVDECMPKLNKILRRVRRPTGGRGRGSARGRKRPYDRNTDSNNANNNANDNSTAGTSNNNNIDDRTPAKRGYRRQFSRDD